MNAAAAWTLLVGLLGASGWLLTVSARMHRRSPRLQAAFRGAALGFLLAVVGVVVLLVASPHRWPPDSPLRLWSVALAVPVLTTAGAGVGHMVQGPGDDAQP